MVLRLRTALLPVDVFVLYNSVLQGDRHLFDNLLPGRWVTMTTSSNCRLKEARFEQYLLSTCVVTWQGIQRLSSRKQFIGDSSRHKISVRK
ncbi:hypothetical protein TNCT_437291 [Trichonephila clavata]|uniref:Uncharacterized protein n=1 Tax=Trichonephila clavata TaxID=2740835 RepID=A0A8X6HPF4_TRICU|nr:hypothetical protein TNCT_437291 [Trichonephila clavata]